MTRRKREDVELDASSSLTAFVLVVVVSLSAITDLPVAFSMPISLAMSQHGLNIAPQLATNGTARDPSLLFLDGSYIYETSYGNFTFSEASPLNYSLTPESIGSAVLYSAIWLNLNATIHKDQQFPYLGPSSILAANNAFFESSTMVCTKENCLNPHGKPIHLVALLNMTWHFYSGWQAPKLSFTLTQTEDWKDKYGDSHLLWIHSVTDYTEWLIEGQCGDGQINVAAVIAPVTEQSEIVVVDEDVGAKLVNDPSQPNLCTRLDWGDYGLERPIFGGQFTNPMLAGPNVVIDFGKNVFVVDPTIVYVVVGQEESPPPPPPPEPPKGGIVIWFQETTTAQTSSSGTSATLPDIFPNSQPWKSQLDLLNNWLLTESYGIPNGLIVFVAAIALAFIFDKKNTKRKRR